MENRLSAEIYALRIKNFLRHIIITYSQFNIMRIKEIKINNFHCYQQTNFQFADRVTILIGKNGSGKSSLIKSIKNALSIFFSNNPLWGYQAIVGSVSDLSVANLSLREIWHDNDMKPAEYVDIRITAEKVSYEDGSSDGIPSWSFRKFSTPKSKLQNSYYKNAYKYFRENYTDNTAWPLFVYYSDRYPHIDAKLSDSIKIMIDNDEKLYRCWGYYHWDKDSSCALIWQERFIRIHNLLFKRQQRFSRIEDKRSKEAVACRKDIEKFTAEIDFVLKYIKKFTSNADSNLSDITNVLQVTDIIVDGVNENYLVAYFADGSRRRWDELPAGYERLYNIVFDIAYRSYILNGPKCEPQGIVLVDELDLHLHPSMEQDVLQRLTSTFEHIQFIVSTHSPLVISNTPLGDFGKIILLRHDGEIYDHTDISDQYGMDYDLVLSAVMDTEPRNAKLEQLKGKYLRLMRRKKTELAEETLVAIKSLVASDDRYQQIAKELNLNLKED